ncbi:MAG: helix-turn-helix transcriptional regulator [Planctomycetota bacterium]
MNQDQVRMLRRTLKQRLSERWTLGDMAELCFLSPFYFCRQFKVTTGLSPYQYLIALRIDHAKHLLSQKPRCYTHLVDVAYRCGFSDQAHLNRHFKRHVGMTPGQFARAQQIPPLRSRPNARQN